MNRTIILAIVFYKIEEKFDTELERASVITLSFVT